MVCRGDGSEAFIVCTQPRRIAAISVAERVAQERGETCGGSVGYQVRLRSASSTTMTRIMFCTTGILLRRLQDVEYLSRISHIIVDEVHERQVDSDFLMALLKQQCARFPHLRIVFMSATIQESMYSCYLSCPIIYVQGRTFPVEPHYLDDVNEFLRKAQLGSGLRTGGATTALQSRAQPKAPVPVTATDRRPCKGSVGGNKKDARRAGSQDLRQGDLRTAAAKASAAATDKPRFDAELTAELVLRIIQKFSQPTNRYTPASSAGGASVPGAAPVGDGILVFLPGIQAILKVNAALRRRGLGAEVRCIDAAGVCYQHNTPLSHPSLLARWLWWSCTARSHQRLRGKRFVGHPMGSGR